MASSWVLEPALWGETLWIMAGDLDSPREPPWEKNLMVAAAERCWRPGWLGDPSVHGAPWKTHLRKGFPKQAVGKMVKVFAPSLEFIQGVSRMPLSTLIKCPSLHVSLLLGQQYQKVGKWGLESHRDLGSSLSSCPLHPWADFLMS